MSDPIQLDRADFAQPAEAPRCGACGTPLMGSYFEINGKMACERCRHEVEAAFNRRGGTGGFLKAALAGLGAAVAGSLLYYAVREITHLEIGLISILVGWGVGKAVHWGSRGKGGGLYQTLAVFLTYMAIVSTYLPAIFTAIGKRTDKEKAAATAPAQAGGAATQAASAKAPRPAKAEKPITFGGAMLGLGAIFLLAAAIPFLAGAQNLIGLLIIAFGLWEAWKINRRTALSISGPFQVGAAPASAPSGS
ncbi:MAG TPA: hypothetical protein VFR03_11500 [Thermoanaerobaculia bacterium]|nr:hypothetical protein [Thermoanaerobaculia bacterium]